MRAVQSVVLGVAIISGLASAPARAAGSDKNLPLLFDPQTKKYFIGPNSKFLLKPGDQAGLIDRIEIAVDNGEYQPYGQAIDFKEEGKHVLKFRAVNPVNAWSPVQFVEVFVDLTAPTSEAKFADDQYVKGDANTYVKLNSTVSLVAQDNLSGVAAIEYSWDGANYNPYTTPLKVEKAGSQSLYYRATDRVGNVELPHKIDFVADGAAPNTTVNVGATGKTTVINGTTYASDAVSYSLAATDDLSKVKQTWVEIDNDKPQIYVNPLYFLKEGPHSIKYYSVDNVGNKEQPKSFAVYTVSTPPRSIAMPIGKSVNTGGINYATRDFQLKIDAKNNVVGLDHVEFKVDQEEYKPYLDAIHFTTPGLHTVTYRAVDRAGNVEPAKSFSVSIVDTPPETNLATAQPLIVRDGVTYSPAPNVLTLNVNSTAGVGVKETLISINDGPFKPYQGSITLGNDSAAYKVAYKSIDKLGNEEPQKTAMFHMIRTVPVIDLFVTNGKSSEEQLRTNYLEQPGDKQQQNGQVDTAAKPESDKAHSKRGLASPNKPKATQ